MRFVSWGEDLGMSAGNELVAANEPLTVLLLNKMFLDRSFPCEMHMSLQIHAVAVCRLIHPAML